MSDTEILSDIHYSNESSLDSSIIEFKMSDRVPRQFEPLAEKDNAESTLILLEDVRNNQHQNEHLLERKDHPDSQSAPIDIRKEEEKIGLSEGVDRNELQNSHAYSHKQRIKYCIDLPYLGVLMKDLLKDTFDSKGEYFNSSIKLQIDYYYYCNKNTRLNIVLEKINRQYNEVIQPEKYQFQFLTSLPLQTEIQSCDIILFNTVFKLKTAKILMNQEKNHYSLEIIKKKLRFYIDKVFSVIFYVEDPTEYFRYEDNKNCVFVKIEASEFYRKKSGLKKETSITEVLKSHTELIGFLGELKKFNKKLAPNGLANLECAEMISKLETFNEYFNHPFEDLCGRLNDDDYCIQKIQKLS